MELEDFDCQIRYRSGRDNCVADCLSRPSSVTPETDYDSGVNDESSFEDLIYVVTGARGWIEKVKNAQNADGALGFVRAQLSETGEVTVGQYKKVGDLHLRDNLVCKGTRIVAPKTLRSEIMGKAHSTGHFGREKTGQLIARNYFWIGMDQDISNHCAACQICPKAKPNMRAREPLELIKNPPTSSGHTLAFDVATLPWSEEGYRYLLLVVDTFSKWIEIIPMRDQTTKSIKKAFLAGWVYRHGVPTVLMSDQGKNVDGEVLHALCDEYGICKKHSSAYHPEGNGTAERAIGKIKQIMRCLLADRSMPKTHWPLLLNEISFISNSLPSASTTVSPQELTYGHILRSPLEAQIDNMQMKEECEVSHHEHLGELIRRREQLEAIAGEENARSRARANLIRAQPWLVTG